MKVQVHVSVDIEIEVRPGTDLNRLERAIEKDPKSFLDKHDLESEVAWVHAMVEPA